MLLAKQILPLFLTPGGKTISIAYIKKENCLSGKVVQLYIDPHLCKYLTSVPNTVPVTSTETSPQRQLPNKQPVHNSPVRSPNKINQHRSPMKHRVSSLPQCQLPNKQPVHNSPVRSPNKINQHQSPMKHRVSSLPFSSKRSQNPFFIFKSFI